VTWPVGWPTVTVNGDYTAAGPSGTVASGTVEFDTVPARLASAQYGVIAVGTIVGTLAGGLLSVVLAATDSLTEGPFVWRVTERLTGQPVRSYYISLPTGTSPVSLATAVYTGELPASYTVITGPQGLQGPKGDKGNDGGGGNYDPAGSAATALATAEAYTDTKVAAEVTRADAAYDHAGAASTAAAAAVVTANAHADIGDAATLAAAEAYTDAHAGGGGSSIKTRSVRITDDNLSGLPAAASWTVVVTSGGTHLQCSIPAVAGDRIRVCPNFMRVGSHFTDFVLLDNTGAISRYASTESSSPGSEGDPAEYPSLSQEYVTSSDMFTVGAGHISGGSATIALAHQGTGTGNTNIIYAHSVYPWRMRLENIGPEPP
jgi:hypothetical protein